MRADGAARMQADADAKQATLDAGGLLVMAAFGSWQDTVPAGMVGVKFTGRNGDSWGLVAEGDYDPGKRPGASGLPGRGRLDRSPVASLAVDRGAP